MHSINNELARHGGGRGYDGQFVKNPLAKSVDFSNTTNVVLKKTELAHNWNLGTGVIDVKKERSNAINNESKKLFDYIETQGIGRQEKHMKQQERLRKTNIFQGYEPVASNV